VFGLMANHQINCWVLSGGGVEFDREGGSGGGISGIGGG
jgi:hypothetical protein